MQDIVDHLLSLRKVFIPQGAPAFDDETFGKDHNCYAYALRLVEHGWATPGRLLEHDSQNTPPENRTQTYVRNAMVDIDGLEPVREHGASRDEHVIAAFVFPEKDFHFYSYDNDGGWSSKYASKPVSRVLGSIFTEANQQEDSTFCGYFRVPAEGIAYHPRLTVINTLKEIRPDAF